MIELDSSVSGHARTTVLGKNFAAPHFHQLQHVVKAGTWFGARVQQCGADSSASGVPAVVGCTVSPSFDFADFTMGDRKQLLRLYVARLPGGGGGGWGEFAVHISPRQSHFLQISASQRSHQVLDMTFRCSARGRHVLDIQSHPAVTPSATDGARSSANAAAMCAQLVGDSGSEWRVYERQRRCSDVGGNFYEFLLQVLPYCAGGGDTGNVIRTILR